MANLEDWIGSLHDGVFETPLLSTFLDQLRQQTGAEYAVIVLSAPGTPFGDWLQSLSGAASASSIERFSREHPLTIRPDLIEGRPYRLEELYCWMGGEDSALSRGVVQGLELTGIRSMRVQESTGVDAFLSIVRRGEDFTSGDDDLLKALAPVLRSVLRLYVAMERERFAASLTAEAARRLHFGWLTLDSSGMVLDCDAQGALVLASSGVLGKAASGRLAVRPIQVETAVFAALKGLAEDPRSRARAITLSRDPWLDMVLAAPRPAPLSSAPHPAAIAYVHGDSWRSGDRCEQLAELFGLSRGEARLALALSRGMSIAEAATEFGLTVETARTYSKTIYAKVGAKGLPDLVRIVMRSILALAPDH